jgi:GNAT superfamily N-acetyltransferase
MSIEVIKTDSKNSDFLELINLLDENLNEINGQEQKLYDIHNKVDYITDVIVIYKDHVAVACGAFKEFDRNTAEVKRIFVRKENRRQGLAKLILSRLEELVQEKGYTNAVLETGRKQTEAIGLYQSTGYKVTPNYGPYEGKVNSVCMRKEFPCQRS